MSRAVGWRIGWRVVAIVALGVGSTCAALLAVHGSAEQGWRVLVRSTARISAILFLLAFSASALQRRWPGPWTHALLIHRRYLGVSFGIAHGFHALAIAGLFRVLGHPPETPTLVVGGFAYLLIAAMVATSFDRSAAWLGPRRWKLLHRTGLYYVWGIFALLDYIPMATSSVFGGLMAAAFVAALGLRLAPLRRTA